MKTDSVLQCEVEEALRLSPHVMHVNIGVSVCDGVVTLNGHVPTFREKGEAEKTVQSVAGVKAVVEKIEVRRSSEFYEHDECLGRAAYEALGRDPRVPALVHIKVEKGWITLSGEARSECQKQAAAEAVLGVKGVVGLFNQITVAPPVAQIGLESEGGSVWKQNQSSEF